MPSASPDKTAQVRIISPSDKFQADSLLSLCRTVIIYRDMCFQLIKRDISARYKETFLGLIWPFLHPLITLAVYVLVFGTIFKAPWRGGQEGVAGYALVLFCGFVPWLVFAEVIGGASTIVVSRPNFVKKMLFPLETLPLIAAATAFCYALPPLCILLSGCLLQGLSFSLSICVIPLLYVPLFFFCLAGAYVLSALGVFVRDVQQMVTALLQILFFATPIIYPLSTIPSPFKEIILLNPLASIVEMFRATILHGQWPDWTMWSLLTCTSVLALWGGYFLFMRTKKGFADVL